MNSFPEIISCCLGFQSRKNNAMGFWLIHFSQVLTSKSKEKALGRGFFRFREKYISKPHRLL
jgi:hypothetical protein